MHMIDFELHVIMQEWKFALKRPWYYVFLENENQVSVC